MFGVLYPSERGRGEVKKKWKIGQNRYFGGIMEECCTVEKLVEEAGEGKQKNLISNCVWLGIRVHLLPNPLCITGYSVFG